jgi:dCMP deaminase
MTIQKNDYCCESGDYNYKEMFWAETFLNIALEMSKHSTCCRLHVGAVLVRDNRIISTGYNGVPKGLIHCEDRFVYKERQKESFSQEHHDFANNYELHAEQNAILYAGRNGISVVGTTMYTTHAPCSNCAKLIAGAGIVKIYYLYEYDRDKNGPILLRDCNIPVIGVKSWATPNGKFCLELNEDN